MRHLVHRIDHIRITRRRILHLHQNEGPLRRGTRTPAEELVFDAHPPVESRRVVSGVRTGCVMCVPSASVCTDWIVRVPE